MLRAAALAGESDRSSLAAARFARHGLAGLITSPASEPVWLGDLLGAERPPWSGREDPRECALWEVYGFLLKRASLVGVAQAVAR